MLLGFFRVSSLVLLAMTFVYISGCAKDPITGKTTHNWFSISYDIKLGERVMREQLAELGRNKKEVDVDRKLLGGIRKIVGRIKHVTHVSTFPYESHLAEVDIVNAWCAPGGKIMVYRGLFDKEKGLVKLGDDDELAAVLGHEVAHANARHVTEMLSRSYTAATIGQVVSVAISSTSGALAKDIFNKVFTGGMYVYIPAYSRKNELEADRVGLFYMARAGYDPQAAVRLWDRVAKKGGDKVSIFASHPPSRERAKALRENLSTAMEEYKKSKEKGGKNV